MALFGDGRTDAAVTAAAAATAAPRRAAPFGLAVIPVVEDSARLPASQAVSLSITCRTKQTAPDSECSNLLYRLLAHLRYCEPRCCCCCCCYCCSGSMAGQRPLLLQQHQQQQQLD